MTSEVGAFPAPTRAPRSLFWLGEARGWCDTMVRITDQACYSKMQDQSTSSPARSRLSRSKLHVHGTAVVYWSVSRGKRENEEGLAGKTENNLCEWPGSARDPVRTQ